MYTEIKIPLPLVLCCLTSFRIFKTDHLTFHALRPNIVETILGLKVNTYWGDLILLLQIQRSDVEFIYSVILKFM